MGGRGRGERDKIERYLEEFVNVDCLDVFIEVNGYGSSQRYVNFSLLRSILKDVILQVVRD